MIRYTKFINVLSSPPHAIKNYYDDDIFSFPDIFYFLLKY